MSKSPATLTVTSPPGPGPFVDAEMFPPSNNLKAPALAITLPAFPDPDVVLEIAPPFPAITRSSAFTATDPAAPLFWLEELELAKIPVSNCPDVPRIDSPPATLTKTLPPDPLALVLLEICPVFTIDKLPALTVTLPAFPLLTGSESDPIPANSVDEAPSIDSRSATLTEIFPPLPAPTVLLKIAPLPMVDKAPALTVMVPAAPLLPVFAVDEIPVKPVAFEPSIYS